MSIETNLKTAIGTVLSGGCYNGIEDSATERRIPYAVFYEISGVPSYGISGDLGMTRCRYQVDVYGRTPEQAKGLAVGVVKTAVEASPLEGVLIFRSAGEYNKLDKSYRYITEFLLWSE